MERETLSDGTSPSGDPWRAGLRLGDLTLGPRLGKGGMGTVFRAESSATGATYAVKVLPAGMALEQLLRFRREGEALARVGSHPHIVQVHSAGEAHGRPYLVMDLLPGGTLAERLREGPLSAEAGMRLVVDLARGLAYAHQQGVLHRDLKPANVLFDERGQAHLADFGLARLAGENSLTNTGAVMGTPGYMSPEQASGDLVDERTDVYGLGAVLYHVLTGRPPFVIRSLIGGLQQTLVKDPTPPSELVPSLPPGATRVCLRALAKDPGDRYANAEALANDLEKLLAGQQLASVPKRRLAQASLLAGLSLLVTAFWFMGRSPEHESTVTPTPPPWTEPSPSSTPNSFGPLCSYPHPGVVEAQFLGDTTILSLSPEELWRVELREEQTGGVDIVDSGLKDPRTDQERAAGVVFTRLGVSHRPPSNRFAIGGRGGTSAPLWVSEDGEFQGGYPLRNSYGGNAVTAIAMLPSRLAFTTSGIIERYFVHVRFKTSAGWKKDREEDKSRGLGNQELSLVTTGDGHTPIRLAAVHGRRIAVLSRLDKRGSYQVLTYDTEAPHGSLNPAHTHDFHSNQSDMHGLVITPGDNVLLCLGGRLYGCVGEGSRSTTAPPPRRPSPEFRDLLPSGDGTRLFVRAGFAAEQSFLYGRQGNTWSRLELPPDSKHIGVNGDGTRFAVSREARVEVYDERYHDSDNSEKRPAFEVVLPSGDTEPLHDFWTRGAERE